tara:strand:- start:755 stop:1042 length:288 start_codon:yes stop_codon:yes gene_type:complete
MIELFLVISVIVNIIFVMYSRWLIRILKTREDDVNELADDVAKYVGHVKGVHEMEMFYGDQTLQSLIEHGTRMIERVETFDFLFSDAEPEEGEQE